MTEQLREACRRVLEEGNAAVVIGYGESPDTVPAPPVFITKPEDCAKLVWNDRCYANLTMYLTRQDVKALGKPAMVVKGCDERALVVLEQESQIAREGIYVIGVACDGVGQPQAAKCLVCDVHVPRSADEVIGESAAEPGVAGERYAELDEFLKTPPEERLAFWMEELGRCVKCYACRAVCPMCYCNRCIVDKNRPTVLDTSATPKGNVAWHIARAFHLAGRCVGCGECTRACPVGINLTLLNQSLARASERHLSYRAGMDRDTPPVIGSYSQEDEESFIL